MAKNQKLTEDDIRWRLDLDASSVEQETHKCVKIIGDLTQKQSGLTTALKQVEKEFGKNSDEVKALRLQINETTDAIGEQRKKLKLLKEGVDLSYLSFSQLRAQYKDLLKQLNDTSKELAVSEVKDTRFSKQFTT